MSGVDVLDPMLSHLDVGAVVGRRIGDIRRAGKRIIVELAHAEDERVGSYLVLHLRMTGRLRWVEAAEPSPGRVRLALDLDGPRLLFIDTRRLGTVSVHDDPAAARPTGVDALSGELDAELLGELIRGSPQPIKPWLMRQDRLAGIGNIYASEICHRAAIDPRRPAGRLDDARLRRLVDSVRSVLREAIDCCGTTFSDFQDSQGRIGSYAECLAVYGRVGETCRRAGCGGHVERIVQDQRSTFFCFRCQL